MSPVGSTDLHFCSPQPDTSLLQDHTHGASASRDVSAYLPAKAGTHLLTPQRMEGWVNLAYTVAKTKAPAVT